MNATRLLADLQRRDVRLSVEDDRLVLDAPKGVVTPALREQLRNSKAEVIRLLIGAGDDRLTEAAIVRWLNTHPPEGLSPDLCGQCDQPLGQVGQNALPFLTGGGGHVWLHRRCHPTWMARRRAEAERALASGL